MTFQPLASSSAGNAYILSAPGVAPLLIDAGVNFKTIQKASGFAVSGLAGCVISHAHLDHCKAVPELLKEGVEVYASGGAWAGIDRGKWANHHRAHHWPVITDSKDAKSFQVGPWSVIPLGARHDAEGTLIFCIRLGVEQLVYITDTAFSDYQFPGTHIFAVEANWGDDEIRANSQSGRIDTHRVKRVATNHMSIGRVEKLLKANDLSSLRETWLLHLSDENSNEAEFKARVQRITGKPVYVASKFSRQEVPY